MLESAQGKTYHYFTPLSPTRIVKFELHTSEPQKQWRSLVSSQLLLPLEASKVEPSTWKKCL
jgi:hypothetical protein